MQGNIQPWVTGACQKTVAPFADSWGQALCLCPIGSMLKPGI